MHNAFSILKKILKLVNGRDLKRIISGSAYLLSENEARENYLGDGGVSLPQGVIVEDGAP